MIILVMGPFRVIRAFLKLLNLESTVVEPWTVGVGRYLVWYRLAHTTLDRVTGIRPVGHMACMTVNSRRIDLVGSVGMAFVGIPTQLNHGAVVIVLCVNCTMVQRGSQRWDMPGRYSRLDRPVWKVVWNRNMLGIDHSHTPEVGDMVVRVGRMGLEMGMAHWNKRGYAYPYPVAKVYGKDKHCSVSDPALRSSREPWTLAWSRSVTM